ncbi:hypothetical protein J1N35_038257 [Gossypium stocksii]|uniref:DUF4283 domain-containing protein n=1 Tax=Gossypium stocksii TaxID=47602 RepID=A0A9D3ULE5_9ROSI|nr:hypothetical protein J1N35_038257 [Gossypium stocksii]
MVISLCEGVGFDDSSVEGNSNPDSTRSVAPFGANADEDLDLLEGDIKKLFVNGIFFIEFSERVQHILIKDMGTTIVLKLMGRNIRYSALQNKINSLWKPASPCQLMEIENGYFLAKFQSKSDSNKVLFKGHWIIYGQYLTV